MDYKGKRVLLIAGGGTLGTYVGKELLRLGASVEVICPEDKVSDHPNLSFYKTLATTEFLTDLFSKNHYDGIVNFLHYTTLEDYKKDHPLIMSATDHLIFLSSYRIYADEQSPITENAPRLLDVVDDEEFLLKENYALPKARCEDYLKYECKGQHWTAVRPVISFSQRRLDLLMYSGHELLRYAESGEELLMPESVRNKGAGLDWAGNSGKLIANLLFKPETYGEAYTVSSGNNLTWGEVTDIYAEILGLKVRWCSEEEYEDANPSLRGGDKWRWIYDRKFDRRVDNSKILKATGLNGDDFTSLADGIKIELELLTQGK